MILLLILILLGAGVYIFIRTAPFGSLPTGARLERIRQSPNYRDGKFQNLSPTPQLAEGVSYFQVMREFIFNRSPRLEPASSLPSRKTDLKALDPAENVLVWFGHSSYYIQADGKKMLVDPVFSGSVSPVSFTNRSYKGSDVYTVADLPEIDYLFISHDHWDHLDYRTIQELKPKVKKVITGLGVGAHLERWGFDTSRIEERDWYESVMLDSGFVVHITPARHFSGRAFSRDQSLWMSFVLKTPSLNLYIGGDSGYDSHFAAIGQKYGPFDLTILECGQYNANWKYIHMMPEEVLEAAVDLKSRALLPVHWAKFSLAQHAWDEPIMRVTKACAGRDFLVVHPMIGQKLNLQELKKMERWWEEV